MRSKKTEAERKEAVLGKTQFHVLKQKRNCHFRSVRKNSSLHFSHHFFVSSSERMALKLSGIFYLEKMSLLSLFPLTMPTFKRRLAV